MALPSRRLIASTLGLVVLGGPCNPAIPALADGTLPITGQPSALAVLARVTARDVLLDSYSVPVHVEVSLHKLVTLHFGLNGTEYFKRPDRLTLELRQMPAQYRRLFGEIGTPLTWPSTYDMRTVGTTVTDGRTVYHIEGTPRRPGSIRRVALDFDTDASAPVRGAWTCTDGTTIAMSFEEEPSGPYELPKRALADLTVSGYRIHAVLDYGAYAFNTTVADSVFAE